MLVNVVISCVFISLGSKLMEFALFVEVRCLGACAHLALSLRTGSGMLSNPSGT